MYKLIASDLDETLLDIHSHVSEKNRNYIQKSHVLGVKFIPATGRGFSSIQGTLEELGLLDKANEYTLSFNGSVLTENHGNRILSMKTMPFTLIQELFERAAAYHVCIHIYTLKELYIFRETPEELAYITKKMPVISSEATSINFLKDTPIIKILFQNTDRSYLQNIEKDLPTALTEQVEISYSANRYLEFNLAQVSKGQALLDLADRLQVQPEEIIAIGDNMNDFSMIKAAGLGVAVANAVPELKEIADYICHSTHQQDALAEVIERFIL